MPLYEYVSEDGTIKVDACRPVKDRDKPLILLRLVKVPAKVRVVGINSSVQRSQSQSDAVLRGYHAQECKLGARFRSQHSAETIKQAWREDKL